MPTPVSGSKSDAISYHNLSHPRPKKAPILGGLCCWGYRSTGPWRAHLSSLEAAGQGHLDLVAALCHLGNRRDGHRSVAVALRTFKNSSGHALVEVVGHGQGRATAIGVSRSARVVWAAWRVPLEAPIHARRPPNPSRRGVLTATTKPLLTGNVTRGIVAGP